jgi:hypothetical protein
MWQAKPRIAQCAQKNIKKTQTIDFQHFDSVKLRTFCALLRTDVVLPLMPDLVNCADYPESSCDKTVLAYCHKNLAKQGRIIWFF